MSDSEINFSVEEAQAILKKYSYIEIKPVESETEKRRLRQAILLVCRFCEWENLGICADTIEAGFSSLKSYLKALGYPVNFPLEDFPQLVTSVYLKFNTQKQSYYLDSYLGSDRGVLISCQSEDDRLKGTYGYFPLDLFEE